MLIPWLAMAALADPVGALAPTPGVQDAIATRAPDELPPVESPWLPAPSELTAQLAQLAAAHPELASVYRLGTSRGGLPIEALRLGLADAPGRPAVLLVAGLDGTRVFESGIALELARRLADGRGRDARVDALFERCTLYVVPLVDPDAAARRFAAPLIESSATGRGVDTDRDGREGEDGPSDVDGDGRVAWMRVPDPEGEWMEDPRDPRALVKADAARAERGRWKLVREGRDSDGDEQASEDASHDAETNRNFAASWEEHAPRAGLFPTDEPGSLALCKLVDEHDDLALVIAFGTQDSLVGERQTIDDDAPSSDRVPPSGTLRSDAELYDTIAETYRELTGIEKVESDSSEGTFQRFCYEHRGLWTLALRLWETPKEAESTESKEPEADASDAGGEAEGAESDAAEASAADEGEDDADEAGETKEQAQDGKGSKKKKEREPSDAAKHLTWIDSAGDWRRFLDWTAYDHPELGPVEIGGFAPWGLSEPPLEKLGGIADAELELLLRVPEWLARVELVSFTAEDLGGGLLRVEAAIENRSLLPLASRSARRAQTVRPIRVDLLLPEGATVVAGEPKARVSDLAGSGGRHEETWLVTGAKPGSIGIEVHTDHAGVVRARAETVQPGAKRSEVKEEKR